MNRSSRSVVLAPLLGIAVLTASCEGQEGGRPPAVETRPAAAAPAPIPPTPATEPEPHPAADPRAETCLASEAIVLIPGEGADPLRMRSLIAGFAGDAGLVAWPAGPDRFEAALLDPELAAVSQVTVELAGSERLFDVLPLAGGFAVLAHDLCPDGKFFQKCLFARIVRRDGTAGPPVTIRTNEWIGEWFPVEIAPGGIVSMRSHMYENPVVERWRAAPDGTLSVEALATVGIPGTPTWVRAFAAAGDRWQAIAEHGHGALRLVEDDGRRTPLRAIPGGVRVDALARDGDRMAVVFTPLGPGGRVMRPRLVRLAADRSAIEPPRPLGDDEQLPGDLERSILPALEIHGGELALVRRNAAGFEVGRATPLGPAPDGHGPDEPLLRAFAAGPGRFGAAWSSFESGRFVVRLASIACGH